MTGGTGPGAVSLAVDTADTIAAAHGQPPPEYPRGPMACGLAVVLLTGRNTAAGRPVWLIDGPGYGTIDGRVSQSLCVAAEAFTRRLTGDAPPLPWRGGALAGLRGTLGPGGVHEETVPWPHKQDVPPVHRFWIDPGLVWHRLGCELQGTPGLARAFGVMTHRLSEPLRPGSGWAMTPRAYLSYYSSWHGTEEHAERVAARLRDMERP